MPKEIKITPEITSTDFEKTIKAVMRKYFSDTVGVGRIEIECTGGETVARIISIEDGSAIKEFKFNTLWGDKIHLKSAVIVFQIEMSET